MKRNILFVDDDPIMRELFATVLQAEPERWEVTTAESGEAALPLLDTTPFDIVVSDMRMSGMDGVTLIREVKRRSPRTARIILSGVVDQKEIAETLRETHQFMPKPFRPKVLKATLARIGGLDAYLQDEKIRNIVAQLDTLPSYPSLYFEIMKELDTPDPSLERVADIVAKDPGMTVKLLQIVNAASLGLARRFTNPVEAVQQLGIAAVQSLALSAHVFTCFENRALKGFSITKLWDHGANTARIARKILELERADATLTEEAYTAGMLHDIGKLMLANNLPEPFQRTLNLTQEKEIRFIEAEQEIFGANHAGVGAFLLGLWGLPTTIVEAVAFHHQPSRSEAATLSPLTAVHVANVLEHELSESKIIGCEPKLDLDHLAALGLQDRIDGWREQTRRLFQVEE
jgi:HD-like signal output (HDOD) protein/ActR/RegA family two-component response regulator